MGYDEEEPTISEMYHGILEREGLNHGFLNLPTDPYKPAAISCSKPNAQNSLDEWPYIVESMRLLDPQWITEEEAQIIIDYITKEMKAKNEKQEESK